MNHSKKKLIRIPIADFEGLHDYLKNSRLREITLQSSTTNDVFVEQAQEAIFSQFILRPKYHSHESSDALGALKSKGYTSRQIATAIAHAVLNDADSIELEQHGVIARYTKTPHLVLYATALSLLTLLGLLYFGRTISASVTMGLLQFEPILAFFGVLFGVAYYKVLSRLFRS